MNTKRKLRLFIQLSMLGALSMGITSTHDAVAFAAASSISQVAEFHNRMQETADNGAITILPINRAKFWAGQRFDFEVEFPKTAQTSTSASTEKGQKKSLGKRPSSQTTAPTFPTASTMSPLTKSVKKGNGFRQRPFWKAPGKSRLYGGPGKSKAARQECHSLHW